MKKIIILLNLVFVIFSFSPSLYEIIERKNLPADRIFVLEHNYMFDYNFYLSRIRQGMEGRWLVAEKYYNQPHSGSLFQLFYLLLGKLGWLGGLEPSVIYHLARLIMGFMLLLLIGVYAGRFFQGIWQIIAYLFIVTAGSWPILVKVGNSFRFATHMGWWSVIDSLQRITFLPHVVLGQMFILLFIWKIQYSSSDPPAGGESRSLSRAKSRDLSSRQARTISLFIWGILGFIAGIIFPPTLIVIYTIFVILSVLEIFSDKSLKELKLPFDYAQGRLKEWIKERGIPRIVFILLSLPSLIYLQLMFKILPWSALALFDVQHRMPIPYKEYFLALGPMLPLGVIGGLLVLKNREKKLLPVVSWVLAVFLLFAIFEKVPTQSPLRFTEAAIHIPLGILTAYFFYLLWGRFRTVGRLGVIGVIGGIIIMGLGVMVSMVGWLTDQAYSKGKGTWLVPIGAQLVYPLKDFMDGIYYLRDNTKQEEVVLSYITAGNYIPAYTGNFVYIGHANTPDEDGKEKIAARFFKGEMTKEEAKEFLIRENIKYIYFGPQEREVGKIENLSKIYPIIVSIYQNSKVDIYKVI